MTRQRIMVTGADGFIGKRLLRHLAAATRTEVVATSNEDLDLLDAEATARYFHTVSPTCVFHLAATGVSHARANDDAVIEENLAIARNVVAGCAEGTKLIVTGSMAEYGGSGVFAESDACHPGTAYGKAKLAVTTFVLGQAKARGIHVCIARLFGVYGPGEAAGRLFPALIGSLRRDVTVPLSDGTQSRDFIHVDDVAACLWDLSEVIREHSPLVVNVGTGLAVRLRDVCTWFADALAKPKDLLDFGRRARSPGDADLLQADTTLLAKVIGRVPPQRLQSHLNLQRLFELDLPQGKNAQGT